MAKKRNVARATAVGAGAGGAGAVVIGYIATELEMRFGIPAGVTNAVLTSFVAPFFMRWAAKLNPHD